MTALDQKRRRRRRWLLQVHVVVFLFLLLVVFLLGFLALDRTGHVEFVEFIGGARVLAAQHAHGFQSVEDIEVPHLNAGRKGPDGTVVAGPTVAINVAVGQTQRKGWQRNVVMDKQIATLFFVHHDLQRRKVLY